MNRNSLFDLGEEFGECWGPCHIFQLISKEDFIARRRKSGAPIAQCTYGELHKPFFPEHDWLGGLSGSPG